MDGAAVMMMVMDTDDVADGSEVYTRSPWAVDRRCLEGVVCAKSVERDMSDEWRGGVGEWCVMDGGWCSGGVCCMDGGWGSGGIGDSVGGGQGRCVDVVRAACVRLANAGEGCVNGLRVMGNGSAERSNGALVG